MTEAHEEEFLASLYKGGELMTAGKVVDARPLLERAHELQPKNEKAQNLLGLAYFKLGLFERASEVYEKLVSDNPVDPTLRVNLGLVYLKANNLDRCIKEFETATDLDPEHKKAHNYLGLALAQAGKYAKAREHFVHAGSDAMAEKMERALAAKAEAPAAVKVGEAAPAPSPTPPPPVVEAQVEAAPPPPVVEEEEEEDEVEQVQAETPSAPTALPRDWGAQFQQAPAVELPSPPAEPPLIDGVEEVLPVIEAVVEAPKTATPVPAASSDSNVDEVKWISDPPEAERVDWVAAPADEVAPPLEEDWGFTPEAEVKSPEPTHESAAGWSEPPAVEAPRTPTPIPVEAPRLPTPLPQAAPAPVAVEAHDDGQWSDSAPKPPRLPTPLPQAAPAPEAVEAHDDTQWPDTAPAPSGETDAASWSESPSSVQSWPEGEAQPVATLASTDEAWAQTSDAHEGHWEAQNQPVPEPTTTDRWARGAVDERQWVEPLAEEPTPATAEDDWGGVNESASLEAPAVDAQATWAEAPHDAEPQAEWPAEAAPAETAPPESAPEALPAWVSEVESPMSAVPTAPLPPSSNADDAPLGYAPIEGQRLAELGASQAWVPEPSQGPFHQGSDGLAITVSGELLTRMDGLVAIVGGLNATPEKRRARGRATDKGFGSGALQLHRVQGHGVVYLEGRRHFSVLSLDDDEGTYLREERVFAFEEPLAFENGRLQGEGGLALDLVTLKGHGKVLLQLEHAPKVMPVPAGTPMVVPLARLVGWFGHVTPRLMGFAGQKMIELTGDGHALLGA